MSAEKDTTATDVAGVVEELAPAAIAVALRARADWLDLPRFAEVPRPYITREQFRAAADLLSALDAQRQEIEALRSLLTRALPSVESDAQMMDAMDRHSPLPAEDMPSVARAADTLDKLAALTPSQEAK